jgi:murein DD-endopeptidase MepM/ murein hydrolase activator NlpD
MGRALRRAVCALIVALACAAPAAAHPDGGAGLSFIWPAQGTVTTPFSVGGIRPHAGIDIGILRSLDVIAAAPGVVVAVGEPTGFEGYGRLVEIDVGGGLTTLYAHLDQSLVTVGTQVWPGDVIGIAGCTGWCTGTHLHFELREDGVAVDPTLLLPLVDPRTG